ncbi:sensor histidine kinase [Sphingomonas glacialis]|uniref:sensor histidine kinase n=1 Tax=Sphingomonas glacialis TaxID=658225 RepID=UPI001387449F|nr:sensor histidine kinase [Sphingomonas glacialis]
MATNNGTFRFDGLSFERLKLPDFLEGKGITANIRAADGTLWLGCRDGTIAAFKEGRWKDTHMPRGPGPRNQVTSLIQTRDGKIWAAFGRSSNGLAWFGVGAWHIQAASYGLPNGFVTALAATGDGRLWVSLSGTVQVLDRGAPRFVSSGDELRGYPALATDQSDRVWISDDLGTRPSVANPGLPSRIRFYRTPAFKRKPRSFFDRDGTLWGFTPTDGMFRIPKPRLGGPSGDDLEPVQRYSGHDGLASDSIQDGFEDLEGNIWVATPLGLERFRASSIAIEPSVKPRAEDELSMHVDHAGAVYFAGANGLHRANPGAAPALIRPGLFNAGCTSPVGEWWSPSGTSGLLKFSHGRFTEAAGPALPSPKSKLSDGLFACSWSNEGALWAAAGEQGFFHQKDRVWFPARLQDPSLYPAVSLYPDDLGRVLAYNHYGDLTRIDGQNRTTLIAGGRHKLANITSFAPVGDAVLIGSDAGLSKWASGKLFTISQERIPTISGISGIVSSQGQTWLQTRNGIARVPTSDLERAFLRRSAPIHVQMYDFADGMPSLPNTFGFHGLALGGDGRVWIATRGGVAWIDPKRLPFNHQSPPIQIRSLHAGGVSFDASPNLRLPRGTRDLQVDFAVLSLTNPKRNQARYRLVGVDAGWVDAGLRRQAFYTNLAPGMYRFEVIGSNNDGIWNRTGAEMKITIPPTFFQSRWFTALVSIALILLAWALYSIRVRHVASQITSRLAERASERERISRELHDTLLQGVQGMLLRFHVATMRIRSEPEAKSELEAALTRGEQIIETARERVKGLRYLDSPTGFRDAVVGAVAELEIPAGLDIEIQVDQATPPPNALVADELARIASEALRNAVLHAAAARISVRLTASSSWITLRVVDDGVGISEVVLERGEKPGHFGLIGMRERASRIGGKFAIQSAPDRGTEVSVTVPIRRALRERGRWWRLLLRRP